MGPERKVRIKTNLPKILVALAMVVLTACTAKVDQKTTLNDQPTMVGCKAKTMFVYFPPIEVDEEGVLHTVDISEVCEDAFAHTENTKLVYFYSVPGKATVKSENQDSGVSQNCATPCLLRVNPNENLFFSITFPNGVSRNLPIAYYENDRIELAVVSSEDNGVVATSYIAMTDNPYVPERFYSSDNIIELGDNSRNNDKYRAVERYLTWNCSFTHDLTSEGVVTNLIFEDCIGHDLKSAVMEWQFSSTMNVRLKNSKRGYVIGVPRQIAPTVKFRIE